MRALSSAHVFVDRGVDLDGDARDEIVVGHGEGAGNGAWFAVYSARGEQLRAAEETFAGRRFGVSLTVGHFDVR